MADRFDLINFGKSVVTTLGGTTANVSIDANTLFIDGTNNRVGVGTGAPNANFQVNGTANVSGNVVLQSTTLTSNLAVSGILSGNVVLKLDGSSSTYAAPSAKFLVDVLNITTNGVYWINLPTVGPTQVFCILDPACAGGGWMMAIKATRGTTFPYTSTHWTTTSTLNPTQTNRNDGDAKFHTYNYFPARDWLAIWPDISNGGDISGGYGGWTWVELDSTGTTESVLTYMNRGVQITKASNGIVYTGTNPGPTGLPKYGNQWSMSGGFQWYGLNYTSLAGARVRWGWATNNENDQTSNDINGGIGMTFNSFSAGDTIACCQVITGINRSARFEWYVR